jgi:hypothetical protein
MNFCVPWAWFLFFACGFATFGLALASFLGFVAFFTMLVSFQQYLLCTELHRTLPGASTASEFPPTFGLLDESPTGIICPLFY